MQGARYAHAATRTTDVRTQTVSDGTVYRYRIAPDGCAHIVKCLSSSERICIPEVLDGCTVASLEDASFSGLTSTRKVICPTRLRRIGKRAFENCMKLADIELNEQLDTIDSEAFFLCQSLPTLNIPSSLRKLGINVAGAQNAGMSALRGNAASLRSADIQIAPDNPYLSIDANGLIYERTEDGLVLIDGSHFKEDTLCPRADTVAIGARALAQNYHVAKAVLPEGCTRIEEEAFRGCILLSQIELPSTLEEIQRAAFSCTALKRIHLPKQCTRIHNTALATGPVIADYPSQPYTSKLIEITVDADNPRLCMVGSVLCRKICANEEAYDELGAGQDSQCLTCSCEDGPIDAEAPLEAVQCTAHATEIDLPARIVRILPTAFAGTAGIKHLSMHEATECPDGLPLLPHAACDQLTIHLDRPQEGSDVLDLEIPSGEKRTALLRTTLTEKHIDFARFLEAYDKAVASENDRLAQARSMISRLAHPLHLANEMRQQYAEAVHANFDTICLHFGARSYWDGFERMADAKLLNEQNIPRVVSLLTTYGDAPAAGYLLEMKRARFGQPTWDFEL